MIEPAAGVYTRAMSLEEDDFTDDDGNDEDDRKEVQCSCRCGACCHLIIEVELEDANREPKIKEVGSPIYTPAALTESGQPELEGYMLNKAENGYACAFLDRASNLCKIYDTRPRICRVFSCDGEDRDRLVQLGVLPRKQA